ncbi:hypothetical protein D3C83_24930 [compost metagenome]
MTRSQGGSVSDGSGAHSLIFPAGTPLTSSRPRAISIELYGDIAWWKRMRTSVSPVPSSRWICGWR